MPTSLDHQAVAERDLVARYRLGRLSADEEERFEAHFLDCAECQQELEAERSFARGLRTVAAQEAARATVRAGVLAWLSRRAALAGLAAAVVVAALGGGLLWRENRRLEERLAAGPLAAPLVGVEVVLLGVTRGDDEPPAISPRPGEPYVLAVDLGGDPRFTGYSLTLVDAGGRVRLERDGLLPNDLEVIELVLPADHLPPGDYRLVARGRRAGGAVDELGSFPFRIAASRPPLNRR